MKQSYSKKASKYLEDKRHEPFSLLGKLALLQELNKKIAIYLDPSIASACQVASLNGERLVLIVANGSVATQLRFQTDELIKQFKSDPDQRLQRVTNIHCKVYPSLLPASQRLATNSLRSSGLPLLSPETAQLITDLADTLTDPELRAVMQKIATHSK